MISSADRCRNCGLLHKTQACPSWGPMFPAPGKAKGDYTEEYERIQNLIAGDILAEHYGHDSDNQVYQRVGHGPPPREHEGKARNVDCPTCPSLAGEVCRTVNGNPTDRSHMARLRAVGAIVRHDK